MAKFIDAQTVESTGAFLQGELERLDPKLYDPIQDYTWGRDIDTREDVTIADEISSFIRSNFGGGFGGAGGLAGGKSWVAQGTTTPARPSVTFDKVMTPLRTWGMELEFDIFELQKSAQVNRPISDLKHQALRAKHQLDIDQMVYLGDAETGATGLLNNADLPKFKLGSIESATPHEILDMFNGLLNDAWKLTAYTRMPDTILLPPAVFAKLVGTQLPNVNKNLLEFIRENNLVSANGGSLAFNPVKYLQDMNKCVAYTKASDIVRFPLVRLQSLPMQYRGFSQIVPYYAALGEVEFVRPEMVVYGSFEAKGS